jgi:hypothetical protein
MLNLSLYTFRTSVAPLEGFSHQAAILRSINKHFYAMCENLTLTHAGTNIRLLTNHIEEKVKERDNISKTPLLFSEDREKV